MYYEDHYHPNATDEEEYMPNENSYIVPDDSSTESSLNTLRKKQRKLLESAKMADKDYRKCRMLVKDTDTYKDMEFYGTTNNQGAKIRNAVDGSRYREYLVGSKNEHMLFKVRCLAHKDPFTMFYDSPEQYERHMKRIIPQDIKAKWVSTCAKIQIQNENQN
jgi:hypothetical protein